MTATTAKARKTTFTATCPKTGERFTRSSLRAYTHAVIYYESVESQRASIQREIDHQREQSALYQETAAHLRCGTTPQAGSLLLRKADSMSYNMQQAGVRTRWDAVVYSRGNAVTASITTAEQYDGYVRSIGERLAALELKRMSDLQERRAATFHHSAALAHKAAKDSARYSWTSFTVVEATA